MTRKPVVHVEYHGTVTLIRPLTKAAKRWLQENVHSEGWQWWGDALACEPRYVEDVVNALLAEV